MWKEVWGSRETLAGGMVVKWIREIIHCSPSKIYISQKHSLMSPIILSPLNVIYKYFKNKMEKKICHESFIFSTLEDDIGKENRSLFFEHVWWFAYLFYPRAMDQFNLSDSDSNYNIIIKNTQKISYEWEKIFT